MQGEELSSKILDVVDYVSDEQFVFVQDMNTGVCVWSKEAVEYFGLPGTNMPNTTSIFGALVHPDYFDKWIQELNDVFTLKHDVFFCEYQIKNAKGEYVPCVGKAKMILDESGRPALFTGSLIIQKKEIERDPTTGLQRTASFLEGIRKAKRNKKCLSIAIEVKGLQRINTLYGYNFGNKVLYAIANYMKKVIGDQGTVYRLDGTDFAIIVDNNDIEFAKQVFVDIREGLNNFELDGNYQNIEIRGGALYTENSLISAQTILSCLLSALDLAKEDNAYDLIVLDDATHESNYKMMELLDGIKAGIRNDCQGFYLCYQPFVSTLTGKIIGAEALVRFRNETFGEVSPGRFVPHLESHPCFYDLSIWILRRALMDVKEILREEPNFFVNVNMSYSQMERESFRYDVISILEELDFPPHNLQLELTERCRNLNLSYLRDQLTFFREHGIRIALDDFGTGSSTINLLCELPISSVKIDQSFILNILDNNSNQVVVESTVECAKRLGLTVCIEGVENQEIRDFLAQYSATYHQGYFYSRPIEFDEFKNIVRNSWKMIQVNLLKGDYSQTLGADHILSMMPGGFFIYNRDDNESLLTVNETLLAIYECKTLDEFMRLTGGSFRGMVHPEDYDRIEESIEQQVKENDASMDFVKYRIITKNGKLKNVRDYGRLIEREDNVALYYVFLVEDCA